MQNEPVHERYWRLVVAYDGALESVKPGQFFHVRVRDVHDPLLRRPLSVYRINRDSLEFLYRVKGAGTRTLTRRMRGDRLDLLGPLGRPFVIPPEARDILLLGRGVGMATLAALVPEAARRGVHVYAVVSARRLNDLLALDLLAAYGVRCRAVTDEEGTSDVEAVRALLERWIAEFGIRAAYTCGSKRLAALLKGLAQEKGLFAQVALEEHMACGLGVCHACVAPLERRGRIEYAKVCQDGPVFDLKEVVFT
ncbi:dihydroorotate dehydrogenase electron transfer subunit [Hydrogenibacillus schlegelii]|uniref:dihydroorotate dehydrogenase electron transfer subunit n=1 Tax=Hydrogenibacillus schlegelii TaxID=1484 RepID=UPI002353285B|nr:dihydroorotate dehydrogenase electron transfer subunit [Hydrogenibacillus schlegelii]